MIKKRFSVSYLIVFFIFLGIRVSVTYAAKDAEKLDSVKKLRTEQVNSIIHQNQINNNFIFYPLNIFEKAVHLGYDRSIGKNFALGSEIKLMSSHAPQPFSLSQFHTYKENYFGLRGQYFLSKVFKGPFFEAGAYNSLVEVRRQDGFTQNGSLWLFSAGIGYRFKFIELGLSGSSYFGESIVYRYNTLPNENGESQGQGPFVADKAIPRIRFGLALSF